MVDGGRLLPLFEPPTIHDPPSTIHHPGKVFVISSPSGGGKTTVVKRLLRRMPVLARSVSVTTRAPRPGERTGRDYRFISPSVFARMRRQGALMEWARVHGAWYGTPKRPLLSALAQGQSAVLSIDVQGARKIRRLLGRRAVLIFLKPPSMRKLRQRLLRRSTEDREAVQERLAAAQRELACASWYDHVVINDRLEAAVAHVRAIIRNAGRINGRES
ncbi:MAG: guanylate kinase [Candidatus Omnitrophica bacterium]|nr:guanylate kinase [Candidatus Omnitrophota bacterium]